MFIVNHRKFFFLLSGALVLGSILAMFIFGLKLGIDFKGGSSLEVSYATVRPSLDDAKANLNKLNLGNYMLTPSGDLKFILKTRDITASEKTSIISALSPITIVNREMTINNAKEEEKILLGERYSLLGDERLATNKIKNMGEKLHYKFVFKKRME